MRALRRLAYRFSELSKLQQYSKAQSLFSQNKYQQASSYFQRCLDIVSKLPKSPQIITLYETAIDNELTLQNYPKVESYCKRLTTAYPELDDKVYITEHIAGLLAGTRKSGQQEDLVLKAVENIVEGRKTEVVQVQQIRKGLLENHSREATIIALSNYLNISTYTTTTSSSALQKSKQLYSPCLTPITTYLNHTFTLTLSPTSPLTEQKQLLPKLTTLSHHKLLYAFSFILFNSQCYSNSILSFWLNIFLKFTETHHRQFLYRPLYLLAVFYQANGKNMVAEGMLNTAMDIVDRRHRPDQWRMLNLAMANVVAQNQKRQDEAEKIRRDNLGKYNFRRVLLEMIL